MKASELKEKSVAELLSQLEELLGEQFKLRMSKATNQLGQTHLLRETRRELPVKTVLARRQVDNHDETTARTLSGRVVSNKMGKSVTVLVERA